MNDIYVLNKNLNEEQMQDYLRSDAADAGYKVIFGSENENGRQGKWLTYVGKKLSEEEYYKDNKKEGLCTYYHNNENKSMQLNYIADNADGIVKLWYPDGQIHIQDTLQNGKLHGPSKRWYQNGQIEYHKNYVDDVLCGVYKCWYRHGQLQLQTRYLDGNQNGLKLEWDKGGHLEHAEAYENGCPSGRFYVGEIRTLKRIMFWDNVKGALGIKRRDEDTLARDQFHKMRDIYPARIIPGYVPPMD